MESNYVVITDIEDLTSEVAKSLLYVGMSRARYGLILLIAESKRNDYRELLKENSIKMRDDILKFIKKGIDWSRPRETTHTGERRRNFN